MSTTHHTEIATGAPANAATVNAPLGELDAAIVVNDGLIAANTANIAANDIDIANNQIVIGDNAAGIAANEGDIAALQGGETVADDVLKGWAQSEEYQVITPVYHVATGTWDTGTAVVWPDGSAGVITIDSRSANVNTLGLIDSGRITHVDSGKTVIQAAYTRDVDGNITNVPALTVA